MPIFEYECPGCGERFEELVRSPAAEAAVACPKCGEKRVEKRVSGFATAGGAGEKGQASHSSCSGSCSHHHCSTCH